MEGNDNLDMTNASTKFCVSWLTIRVCCSQFYCGLEFTEHRVVEAASKYLGYLYSSDNRTPSLCSAYRFRDGSPVLSVWM